eukprot:m.324725 g.324725  ORF g.324725 m.324725 type:complete len:437 (-) comp20374_c0_seq8:1926-3236(-)
MKTSTLSLVAAAAATISACVAHVSADMVVLAKFNGTDDSVKWKWVDLNDPVMGGQSTSTFSSTNSDGIAVFNGTTRVVPSLKAPGFCNAKTTDILKRANDASAYINDALLVRVRSTIAYGGYFMSFAADTIDPQFKSYKAPFEVIADGEWRTVAIPFTNFSNDWSSFTGRCDTVDPTGAKHKCCSPQNPEVCPSSKNLKDIEAFGIWTEGVAGDFHLEIEWIAAGTVGGHAVNTVTATAPAPPAWKSSCAGDVQQTLRYNMSSFKQADLPGAYPGESLAQAVCCDVAFKPYAEPAGTFQDANVALFDKLNKTGVNVFYDSVCGKPLFQAPIGRSFEAWREESINHGWPSFRDVEVFKENVSEICTPCVVPVIVRDLATHPCSCTHDQVVVHNDTGEVVSACGKGTHLGSYAPDNVGPRFCIDLACISGSPLTVGSL